MPVTPCLHQGADALQLTAPGGASAVVALHGAHVLSWWPAGSDRNRLYLSPRSTYAAGQAIRGGVPVVFPQFSDRGPLPRHGFARTMAWQHLRSDDGPDGATAVLQLRDDAGSRRHWPHAFVLELSVTLSGPTLRVTLACRNTGPGSLQFQCALHSYLHVRDIALAAVDGLRGRRYHDAPTGTDARQQPALLRFDGEVDRVYPDVADDLVLHGSAGDASGGLRIGQHGFEDIVVWNPGATRCAALSDMPPDGYRQMVCVEAARIGSPVVLEPGAVWQGWQQLRVPA